MTDQDQEITLGTGRLLGLFFGLVIICALFFSLGFSLGRRSATDAVALAASTSAPAIPSGGPSAKPSPGRSNAVKTDCSTPGACPDGPSKSSPDELTFYKAVEQNDPKAQLDAPSPPEIAKPASTDTSSQSGLGTGYMVQVAAVSKQDDADALVSALRRKNYPVITTSGSNDRLYHVQVGPFSDVKEAESTRSKLIGDGYNPILKK